MCHAEGITFAGNVSRAVVDERERRTTEGHLDVWTRPVIVAPPVSSSRRGLPMLE